METITIEPSELAVVVQESDIAVTVRESDIAVAVQETGAAVIISPTENAVNILSGATITNNYGSDTVAVTAAENLSGHRIVTVEGYYASKDTATDKFKVLGMTTGAVVSGDTATVQISGFITEAGWNFTIGSPIFLGTNGAITQTVPTSGCRIIIGKPQTATTIFLELSEPIITA